MGYENLGSNLALKDTIIFPAFFSFLFLHKRRATICRENTPCPPQYFEPGQKQELVWCRALYSEGLVLETESWGTAAELRLLRPLHASPNLDDDQ